MIEDILAYNKQFVAEKGYEEFVTDKYPNKKLAIVTCMDTRLIELLPAALGIKNGDAKIIKNAGGVISSPLWQRHAQSAHRHLRARLRRDHGHRPHRLRRQPHRQ